MKIDQTQKFFSQEQSERLAQMMQRITQTPKRNTVELEGLIVDLDQVTLVKKHNAQTFLIYLKGVPDPVMTRSYDSPEVYEHDYKLILAILRGD